MRNAVDKGNMRDAIAEALISGKAENVVYLDLGDSLHGVDGFLIATGKNPIHIRHLSEVVQGAAGETYRHEEKSDNWHLVDLGEIVVHIFSAEYRIKYDLEGRWPKAKRTLFSAS